MDGMTSGQSPGSGRASSDAEATSDRGREAGD